MIRPSRWLPWLLGIAVLAAVIAAALHLSEGRDFIRLAEDAEPWWLTIAVLLQSATYAAQGEIWRRVGTRAGAPLPGWDAFRLSLAKLFADQALPSAGISGSIVVARTLEQRGVRPGAINAVVLINLASYHLGYIAALAAALAILQWEGHATLLIVLSTLLFVLFAVAVTAGVIGLSGVDRRARAQWISRFTPLRSSVAFIQRADPQLIRNPRLLVDTTALQVGIILLDAATMWVLLRSLGTHPSATGVFASFMIASLVRTIGIVPGGLGTFEATSVLTLAMTGTTIPIALSATLLFRGLSFWLPMVPGLWLSRRMIAAPRSAADGQAPDACWALPASDVLRALQSTFDGLSTADATARLRAHGPNQVREHERLSRARVLWRQVRNPLLLLLVFAAGASAVSGEWVDSGIVLAIVVSTVAIGYSREYGAHAAADALRARVRTCAQVIRDGRSDFLHIEEIVPGDVVLLSAGSLVPADGILLEATDFYVSEAVLTGESFPVAKQPGIVAAAAPLAARTNCVYLGTNVRSGTARCLIARTGASTQFGAIAQRLTLAPPETEFDRGIKRFGYLLTSAMVIMVLVIFAAHVLQGRPPVETLLFAVALAVGLSPELLPAVLSVNLARGARMMARGGVLVRRLNAIENLGSMDVLCTDKTGTLTEGVVKVEGSYDQTGAPAPAVLELAAVNATLETGLANPLDEAIVAARRPDLSSIEKLAEIPFDFIRKRLSVIIRGPDGVSLVTKGAFAHVLEICSRTPDGELDAESRHRLLVLHERWSGQGVRVIAVATRTLDARTSYGHADETGMTFAGFVTFLDRPKADAAAAIAGLAAIGVAIKVITGDNRLVTEHVARLVGMPSTRVLTGEDLDRLNDEALWHAAEQTDLFVEVDPNQKERIILALKKMGHVVGFLGDGVNDAPAMHAADTSLSVEQAVDVAREAADFVLLQRDLDVIRRGVEEGRRTFANTMKYILTTTSANLGNMVSMAAVSLFLPFLPLLAGQILLNNFLSDIPAVGLAGDSVDPEMVERPRRWDIAFIGKFMVVFGILSSVFDFLTFGMLRQVFRAGPDVFRTGWFIESLLTELLVALVVRTSRPFYRSRPGRVLLWSTTALVIFTFMIPYIPVAGVFGFVPLEPWLLLAIGGVAVLYVGATELAKRRFYGITGAVQRQIEPGQLASARKNPRARPC